MEGVLATGDEPQARADSQLPGRLLGTRPPVGQRLPSSAGERHVELPAARQSRERRPELALRRSATDRGVPAPAADRDDDVGIDEAAGHVERPALVVGGEVGGVGLIGGIEGCGRRDRCRGRGRFETRGLEYPHVVGGHAGGDEPLADRRHDRVALGHGSREGHDHTVARHDMGLERRPVGWGGHRRRDQLAGLVASDALRAGTIDDAASRLGLEDERGIGSILQGDRIVHGRIVPLPGGGRHGGACGVAEARLSVTE